MHEFFSRLIRATRGLWRSVRARVLTTGSLILFLGFSFYIFGRLIYKESHDQLGRTLESFAEKFSQTLEMLDLDFHKLDTAAHARIRTLFRDPMYGNTGYPFVVQMTGEINFHFFRDGDRLSREVLDLMSSSPSRRGTVRINFGDSQQEEREVIYTYVRDLDCFLAIEVSDSVFDAGLNTLRIYSWGLFLVGSLLAWLMLTLYMRRERRFNQALLRDLSLLAEGSLPDPMPNNSMHLEGNAIVTELNKVIVGLSNTTSFVRHLAADDLTQEYTPLGLNDALGNSLLELRSNLQKQKQEAETLKEAERIRSWTNEGLAEFAKLLRENSNDIAELVDILLQRVVNYLDATQGGLYLAQERKSGTVLHLASAFAYNRKKYMQEDLPLGEGLVGTCAIERDLVHIDVLPPEYCDITSGIGNIPPKELLLVPLKTDDALLGVLELASLKGFAPYMVTFAQLLSVSIAQTLQQAQTNQRTAELLQQSQEQREAMRSQEEEMRQNMEEMQATQEEMTRRTQEFEILENVVEQSVYYAEFAETGIYVRGNRRFEDYVHQKGIVELVTMNLKDVATAYTTSGQEDVFATVWTRVLDGFAQTRLLSWKGYSNSFLYATLLSFSHDGNRKVYLLAQDVSSLLFSGSSGGSNV